MTTRTVSTELTPAQRQAFEEAVERYGKSFFANPDLIWKTLLGAQQNAQEEDVRSAVDAKFAVRVAFRKAVQSLPEIAPKEVLAVLGSVPMSDAFFHEGKRLQRLYGLDAVAPRVEQECAAGVWSFMRQGILAASPKPTDAEKEVGDD